MKTKINDLESEINTGTLYQENEKLSKKCQQLKDQSRRNNLIFYGIEGAGKQTWSDCETNGLRVLVDTCLSQMITFWCLYVRSMFLHWVSS